MDDYSSEMRQADPTQTLSAEDFAKGWKWAEENGKLDSYTPLWAQEEALTQNLLGGYGEYANVLDGLRRDVGAEMISALSEASAQMSDSTGANEGLTSEGGNGYSYQVDAIKNETALNEIAEFVQGNKSFDEVVHSYSQIYAEAVLSNENWLWEESILGGEQLTRKKREEIRIAAIKLKLIPEFEVAGHGGVIFRGKNIWLDEHILPQEKWLETDYKQFKYLDQIAGGKKKGTTWHHTNEPGVMQRVPRGIHKATPHVGGRKRGNWSDAKR